MKLKWLTAPILAVAVFAGMGIGRLTAPEPINPLVEAQKDYEEERALAEHDCGNWTILMERGDDQAFYNYMTACYWPDWPDGLGKDAPQWCLQDAEQFDVSMGHAISVCWRDAPITLTPTTYDGAFQAGSWNGLEPAWEPGLSYIDYWRGCVDDYEISVRITGHDAVVEIGRTCDVDPDGAPDAAQH